MKKLISFFMLAIWISAGTCVFAEETSGQKKTVITADSKIQVAILLDTSGSMNGLIEQAKTKIWTLINELVSAKKDGKTPKIEIALYEYGNDGVPSKDQYVRKIAGLSTDLDKISEELFKLTTNGGSEYCGYAIKFAHDQLEWSKSASDLKIIFICGNEEFTQGAYNYVTACKDAIKDGIIVNTIHCGDEQVGISQKWKDGADLTDGKYMFINQNAAVVSIVTPYDTTIQRLNGELNKTYLGYGSEGEVMKDRQKKQDDNAANYSPGVAATRGAAKASEAYDNSSWDLVDGVKKEKVKVKDLKDSDLPAELKGKSDKEKEEYIKNLADKRAEIQKKILEANALRTTFIAKNAKSSDNTLDKAMIEAIRAQATRKHYSFK